MKILAEESYNSDGFGVSIHITPTAPMHQDSFYFDLNQVMAADIDENATHKRGSVYYTATVFKKHLPAIYDQLKKHNYDMVLSYNVDYF
jgi:hypothetical protein